MLTIPSFTPGTLTPGHSDVLVQVGGKNKGEQLLLINFSQWGLTLRFPDGRTDFMPPLWIRTWKFPSTVFSNFKWNTALSIAMSVADSRVLGILYESSETIEDINMPLSTSVVIGNANGVTIENMTNISSAGLFSGGTQIALAYPTGDSDTSGAVQLYNDGSLVLGDTGLGAGSVKLRNGTNVQFWTCPSPVILNGATNGTATLLQDFQGDIKRVMVRFSAFRNNGAAQTIAIPVPFIHGAALRIGSIGCTLQLLASGIAQNIISYASGANSTSASTTGNIIGECQFNFDTISLATSTGSTNGFIIMEGW